MDKLNKVLYDSGLAIVEQDTDTIEAFNQYQNYFRAIAPYATDWIPYAIFYPTNASGNVGIPAEYLVMTPNGTTIVDGQTYYIYECDFPAAVVGSARATKIDVTLAFISNDNNVIGVSLFDETAEGYNDTTYIAAQLLIDYPDAVTDDVVRVFNTDTDWEFNGTAWVDQDEYLTQAIPEHRADTVEYTLQRGTSTSRPTYAPNNTETIISQLTEKIGRTEALATFYTQDQLDALLLLKLSLTGGTMQGDIAMGSNSITGLADGAASGDAVNKGQLDLKVNLTRQIAGVDLQDDITKNELQIALDVDDLQSDKVDKTQTILGIDFQDNITLVEFKAALGEATEVLNGLMSATDKARLNTLFALLSDDDADSVVDTIQEVLNIFDQYPEGSDLVSVLATKVDKVAGKALSTNDYTDAEQSKVTNLPLDTVSELALKIDKDFTGLSIISLADQDSVLVYDNSGAVLGRTTISLLASYILAAAGTFSPNATYDAETTGGSGLTAELAQRSNSTRLWVLTKNADGQYYVDTGTHTLSTNHVYEFVLPTATETDDLTISLDGSTGTYHSVLASSNGIPTNLVSAKRIPLKWNGTEFDLVENEFSLSQSLPYKSAVGQHTIPFNEVPTAIPYKTNAGLDEAQGQLIQVIASDTDVADAGTLVFASVSGVDYYDTLNGVIVAGTGGNLTFTNSSGGLADMMAIVVPTELEGANDTETIANIEAVLGGTVLSQGFHATGEARTYVPSDYPQSIQDFIENKQGIASGEQINGVYYETVGKNLFDKNEVVRGFYIGTSGTFIADDTSFYQNDFSRIKGNTSYTISFNGGTGNAIIGWYDSGFNFIERDFTSSVANATFVSPTNACYLKVSGQISKLDIEQLELGTTATTYEAYENSVQHIDTSGMLSITDTSDNVYRDTLDKKYIGIETGVGIGATINDTTITTMSTVSRFIAVDETTGETQRGDYGDTLTLTNTATVYYLLATPTPRTIEVNGEQIVSTNSTYSLYSPVLPYKWYVSSAYSRNAQIDLGVQQDIKQGKKLLEHDGRLDVVEDIVKVGFKRWEVSLTKTQQGALSKPDYDFTNLGLLFPQNNNAEIAYIQSPAPQDWIAGTRIYPSVEVRQEADQQAVFKIDYKLLLPNEPIPATWSTYTMENYKYTYSSGSVLNVLDGGGGIDTTGATNKAVLLIKLYRDDNVYTGDMLAYNFFIRYQAQGFGQEE